MESRMPWIFTKKGGIAVLVFAVVITVGLGVVLQDAITASASKEEVIREAKAYSLSLEIKDFANTMPSSSNLDIREILDASLVGGETVKLIELSGSHDYYQSLVVDGIFDNDDFHALIDRVQEKTIASYTAMSTPLRPLSNL